MIDVSLEYSIVIASEAKQSSAARPFLDCFVAELVIGPATSGRTRWLLAMTAIQRKQQKG
jgi:hypothetical protein